MTAEVTYEPAAPRPAIDGIYFTVTGEVPVLAHLEITDDDDRVRGVSTVFKQGLNPRDPTNEITRLTLHGGTSGTFTLGVDGYDDTDPIYYLSDDPTYTYPLEADVEQALTQVLPRGTVVTATKHGNYMDIEIGGTLAGQNLTVDGAATIGGSETFSVAQQTAGGTAQTSPSGPYGFGPVYLGEGDYTVRLIANEGDDDDISEGDNLSDPVYITVEDE